MMWQEMSLADLLLLTASSIYPKLASYLTGATNDESSFSHLIVPRGLALRFCTSAPGCKPPEPPDDARSLPDARIQALESHDQQQESRSVYARLFRNSAGIRIDSALDRAQARQGVQKKQGSAEGCCGVCFGLVDEWSELPCTSVAVAPDSGTVLRGAKV